jgi:2-polyprenyl-6-methoxyphenol hydroxylase-like FAD-dependent oxidoreductase
MAAGSVRRQDGKVISRADLDEVGRAVGAPAVAIHRATLQRLLVEALGQDVLEMGCKAVSYEARADGVTFAGQGACQAIEDAVLLAEGLARNATGSSMTRAQLVSSLTFDI